MAAWQVVRLCSNVRRFSCSCSEFSLSPVSPARVREFFSTKCWCFSITETVQRKSGLEEALQYLRMDLHSLWADIIFSCSDFSRATSSAKSFFCSVACYSFITANYCRVVTSSSCFFNSCDTCSASYRDLSLLRKLRLTSFSHEQFAQLLENLQFSINRGNERLRSFIHFLHFSYFALQLAIQIYALLRSLSLNMPISITNNSLDFFYELPFLGIKKIYQIFFL